MSEMFRFDLRVFAREKEVVGARRLVYSFFFLSFVPWLGRLGGVSRLLSARPPLKQRLFGTGVAIF
jgi:hypothetical protein